MAVDYDGDQPWADKAVDEFYTTAMDPDSIREEIERFGSRIIHRVLSDTPTEMQVWSPDNQDSLDVDMTSYAEGRYAEEIAEAIQNAADTLIDQIQGARFA